MFWNFFIAFLYLWYKISVTAYLFHIYIYSIILLQIKLISSLTYLQTHRQGCCVSVGWSRSKWARAWTAPSSSPCMLEQHIIGLLLVYTHPLLEHKCAEVYRSEHIAPSLQLFRGILHTLHFNLYASSLSVFLWCFNSVTDQLCYFSWFLKGYDYHYSGEQCKKWV